MIFLPSPGGPRIHLTPREGVDAACSRDARTLQCTLFGIACQMPGPCITNLYDNLSLAVTLLRFHKAFFNELEMV